MSVILDDITTEQRILDALKDIADQLRIIRMHNEIITGEIIKTGDIDED